MVNPYLWVGAPHRKLALDYRRFVWRASDLHNDYGLEQVSGRNSVWVERSPEGNIVRIFRSTHGQDWSRAMSEGTLQTCPKKDAVGAIRYQIWKRCDGRCEWCGKRITESGPLWQRMHCHEQIPKGNGGEVSIFNCVGLCQKCHFNDDRAHGNRKLQFSKEE